MRRLGVQEAFLTLVTRWVLGGGETRSFTDVTLSVEIWKLCWRLEKRNITFAYENFGLRMEGSKVVREPRWR